LTLNQSALNNPGDLLGIRGITVLADVDAFMMSCWAGPWRQWGHPSTIGVSDALGTDRRGCFQIESPGIRCENPRSRRLTFGSAGAVSPISDRRVEDAFVRRHRVKR
jgi:hypothetical protein